MCRMRMLFNGFSGGEERLWSDTGSRILPDFKCFEVISDQFFLLIKSNEGRSLYPLSVIAICEGIVNSVDQDLGFPSFLSGALSGVFISVGEE